ncbi:MAG: NHL repeat-containing protein, partial [Pseudomonadales bacterium]
MAAPAPAFEHVSFLGLATFDKLRVTDVAFLPSGELLVLDGSAAQVYVFGSNGEFRASIGTKGRGVGQLYKPTAIAVDVDSRILVADNGTSRITVFDRNGDFAFSFGSRGAARGQFRDLVAIESDLFGFIYVADKANSRVSRFARSGVLLDVIDLPSPPQDLALDLQLNVYVLMPELQQIQLWRMDGQRMGAFVPKPQNMLGRVTGFAVDGRGDVYVADRGNHRVLKFSRDGTRLVAFGSK